MPKGKRGPRPEAKEKPEAKPKPPKQARLPGTEDARIDALEDAAEEYANIRDQRLTLSMQEVDLKKRLLALMKGNQKTHYKRNGISIDIEHEQETVKVRVKKEEEHVSDFA